jgi:small subunit ribosomal protein S4
MTNRLHSRYRIVRSTKIDPWGKGIFYHRRFFLRSFWTYYKKIQSMKRKKNFKNVLLLDSSRGKIRKRRGRKTLYGKLLKNKQLLKKFYFTLKDRQFRKLAMSCGTKRKIRSHELFLRKLELRLDVLLYRCHFAPSVAWARQVINHGNFIFYNKIIDRPVNLYSLGNEITFFKHPRLYYNILNTFRLFKKNLKPIPNFLLIDYKALRLIACRPPILSDLFYTFNANFTNLIQFYQNRRW